MHSYLDPILITCYIQIHIIMRGVIIGLHCKLLWYKNSIFTIRGLCVCIFCSLIFCNIQWNIYVYKYILFIYLKFYFYYVYMSDQPIRFKAQVVKCVVQFK